MFADLHFMRVFYAALVLGPLLLLQCVAPAPAGRSPAGPEPTSITAPPTPSAATGVTMASPDYAVHVFLWGNPDTTARDLRLAKDAGFTWVKQRFEWRYIEGNAKGRFEWGEPDRIVQAISDAGLKLVARVDNQPRWARSDQVFPGSGPPDRLEDWAEFLSALATRYRGRIHAYELWNEPNLAREWGQRKPDPRQYLQLLKAGYQAIKQADPSALVISAGLSPTTDQSDQAMPDILFLRELYQQGASAYFDVLGVHAAGFKAPPEADPATVAADPTFTNGDPSPQSLKRAYAFRHVEDLRQVMVEHGDSAKQVAALEMGWSSDPRKDSPYFWHSVTEQQKGEYLTRAFQWARDNWRPWIGLMTVIYIADPRWTLRDEQYYWSITNPDGSLRPAYLALKGMPK